MSWWIWLALGAVGVAAQDPHTVAPQAYRKQLENDRVRVTRVRYEPRTTIAEHEHPSRPTIFIYLNDGPPIQFKHQHGDSGDYAATRAATKAGAYRLAAGRSETHVVENRSDLPSDFLQVELKTAVDAKTFSGRRFRDAAAANQSFARVEYDSAAVRITRINCVSVPCAEGRLPSPPASGLLVATATGETRWVEASGLPAAVERLEGEHLVIEIR